MFKPTGKYLAKLSILILAMFHFYGASAQKVAVVLSGGGAKGLAHAGVLKALEENEIPIDGIAGTSMGALVGAFYASGFSTDEIIDFAVSEEMQNWIKNKPAPKYRAINTTQAVDPSWVSLKLSIDSSFSASFNPSLADDVFLNFGLAKKFAKSTSLSHGNFDKLFVPYRATASEIFTQQDHILKSGNLFEAARASMAVPFFFRPIKIKDEMLFDGGIYNNFPAETARYEFDPDIIIGVNVASKEINDYPYDKDESIIAESVLFAILDKTDSTELSIDDIFIDVDVKEHHALDFKKARKIIDLGYEAAMKKMPEIKSRINKRISKQEIQKKRDDYLRDSINIQFDRINIDGFNSKQKTYILGLFDKNRPLTFDQIEEGYNHLVADDYFINIIPSYSLSSPKTFKISGNPNPRLKSKIGGSLVSRNISQLYIGLDLKRLSNTLNHYSFGLHTGKFYQSINLRTKVQFAGIQKFAIIPEVIYNRWDFISTSDFFNNDKDPQIQERIDFSYGGRLEFQVLDKYYLDLSLSGFINRDKFSNTKSFSTSDTLDVFDLAGNKIKISLINNSLNYYQYPTNGHLFELYAKSILAEGDYRSGNTSNANSNFDQTLDWIELGLNAKKFIPAGKIYTLGLSGSAIYSNRPALDTRRLTVLNQVAYEPFQDSKTLILSNFRGRSFAAFGLHNVFNLQRNLQFRIEGYALLHFEQLNLNSDINSFYERQNKIRLAATSSLVFETLVGPIALNLNYYDQPEQRWGVIFQIGHLFFNKRSLD